MGERENHSPTSGIDLQSASKEGSRSLVHTALGLFALCGLLPQIAAIQVTVALMLALLVRVIPQQAIVVDHARMTRGMTHRAATHRTAPA